MKFTPCFSGVRITRSLVLCICFVDRWVYLLNFFFWPLCCLFFDTQILITPLISSNSSNDNIWSYFIFQINYIIKCWMFNQYISYILKGYENIWIWLSIVSHWDRYIPQTYRFKCILPAFKNTISKLPSWCVIPTPTLLGYDDLFE
jgi:hypothetical protein